MWLTSLPLGAWVIYASPEYKAIRAQKKLNKMYQDPDVIDALGNNQGIIPPLNDQTVTRVISALSRGKQVCSMNFIYQFNHRLEDKALQNLRCPGLCDRPDTFNRSSSFNDRYTYLVNQIHSLRYFFDPLARHLKYYKEESEKHN